MRFKVIYLSIITMLIFQTDNLWAIEAPPSINARSYILMDQKSGAILCEKNADEKLYPASTTKIMTAIIAIENGKSDQQMTASKEAVNSIGPGGMNIGIQEGEVLPMEDLLNALLVRSANETSYILAENICKTRQEFIDLMNKKALELGANNTHFVNPCGMDTQDDEKDHLSTARDLALIARYGMSLPKFKEIVGKKTCTIAPTNKHPKEVILSTTNKLILNGYKSDYFNNITGIKTGYTVKAGHNLISSAINADGTELISVILDVQGPTSNTVFEYSKQLLEYGFKNYSLKEIVPENEVIDKISVTNAKDNLFLSIATASGLKTLIPNSENEFQYQKDVHINRSLTAPVHKGDKIGYIDYTKDGISLGKVDLVAAYDILEKPKGFFQSDLFKTILKHTLNICIIILSILFLRIFLRVILRIILRKMGKKVRCKKFI